MHFFATVGRGLATLAAEELTEHFPQVVWLRCHVCGETVPCTRCSNSTKKRARADRDSDSASTDDASPGTNKKPCEERAGLTVQQQNITDVFSYSRQQHDQDSEEHGSLRVGKLVFRIPIPEANSLQEQDAKIRAVLQALRCLRCIERLFVLVGPKSGGGASKILDLPEDRALANWVMQRTVQDELDLVGALRIWRQSQPILTLPSSSSSIASSSSSSISSSISSLGSQPLRFRVSLRKRGSKCATYSIADISMLMAHHISQSTGWRACARDYDAEVWVHLSDHETIFGIPVDTRLARATRTKKNQMSENQTFKNMADVDLYNKKKVELGVDVGNVVADCYNENEPQGLRGSIAACMVRLLGLLKSEEKGAYRSDRLILMDPMAGYGGLLEELCHRFRSPDALVLGGDIETSRVMKMQQRFHSLIPIGASPELICWDASSLPLKSCSVDGIVVDLPFGRQHSFIAIPPPSCSSSKPVSSPLPSFADQLARCLREWARVANAGARAVVLTGSLDALNQALAIADGCWECHRDIETTLGMTKGWIVVLVKSVNKQCLM